VTDIAAQADEAHLRGLLDGLFRPVGEAGFWDPEDGRIVARLDAIDTGGGRFRWKANDSIESKRYRYSPFAFMGLARWRTSPLGDDTWDHQIHRNVEHYVALLHRPQSAAVPSYGLGAIIYTFAVLGRLWPDLGLVEMAHALVSRALDECQFAHSEDAILLVGASALSDTIPPNRRTQLVDHCRKIRSRQDSHGLFRFDNVASHKHQNQMYTIWGLAGVDLALTTSENADSIRRCLEFTVSQRMQRDGALLWHEYRGPAHKVAALARSAVDRNYAPERHSLFSCHQAFFVHASDLYRRVSHDTRFDSAIEEAITWLYGRNAAGSDLFELTGIGLPLRMMTTDGRTDWPHQRFIGSYEIGGMLLALVDRLERKRGTEFRP
jgi:hypothetical protein